MTTQTRERECAALAKALAAICVRNTFLEELHAGGGVTTLTGDFSDVKVVMPGREVPWNDVSRIGDGEMKKLMIEVVNRLYTVLISLDDEEAMERLFKSGRAYTHKWDEPEFLPGLLANRRSETGEFASDAKQP